MEGGKDAGGQGEITRLLHDWREGDARAPDRLLDLVYLELKRIAMRRLASSGMRAMDSTELVNEALLGLLGSAPNARDREHFFRLAARAIRYTLIDIVRQQQAEKRGGGAQQVTLTLADHQVVPGDSWLDVEAALEELERHDPRKCRIVELAFLTGLNQQEIAEALSISLSTVERDLRFAKAWLRDRLAA